ncbi:hypothetical protein CgunFtcFv8_012603 [Champsocephalus gunnari]|uniref:Uncharacterized protein n=1 Tax=Champsocephalus gunnari TaxID=52237 RepID=A0AAN8HXZ4_CHAGU|nr:hypothetical protein CgunFtcFv8_012603 [Champsocephalus gunnari]
MELVVADSFQEECETGAAATSILRLLRCRQLCQTQEPLPQETPGASVLRRDRPPWLTVPWVTGDSMVRLALATPPAPQPPSC